MQVHEDMTFPAEAQQKLNLQDQSICTTLRKIMLCQSGSKYRIAKHVEAALYIGLHLSATLEALLRTYNTTILYVRHTGASHMLTYLKYGA